MTMARNILEIQNDIFVRIASNPDMAALNATSKVSVYRLLVFVFSYAVLMLEKILDVHAAQVDKAIYENKPGTARWYRNMALKFQMGMNLLTDDDEFDNTRLVNGVMVNYTADEIEASKIIKYCSVRQSLESSRLIIKIAGETGENLRPLVGSEIDAFDYYMSQVAYAGVKIDVVNNPADQLLLNIAVYRNPLVLDSEGNNIANGGQSVPLALKQYMKNLPFDGELVINDLIGYLRNVPGVINVHIISAQSKYKDMATGLFTDYKNIDVKTVPVAGYFIAITPEGETAYIDYVV